MTDVSPFVRGGGEFTVELFRKLNAGDTKENIIISPFSIQACMALAYAGAKGETANEIAKAMKYNCESSAEIANEFANILTNYSNGELLKIANKIYVQDGQAIKPEYAAVIKEKYHAESEAVNFGDSVSAANNINSWVEMKTNGKILDLISPDVVDASISLVLLNAIYFKGLWKDQFDAKFTSVSDFWVDKNEAVKVEFMRQEGQFNFAYFEEHKCMALELPYRDSDLSMFIVLPFERCGLKQLAKKLKDANLMEMAGKLRNGRIEVHLPKFKIEYSVEVSKVLQEIGIIKAFSGDADFSNILQSSQGYSISQVFHKAVIEVNEEGTEAAAASCAIMARCLPPQFQADHPFFYWIWNRKNVMFAGAFVTAPAKA